VDEIGVAAVEAEGVHVFGAASMGALRAAELEQFGMVGVGAIFGAYRDGVLEDDDEVAVAHGAEEDSFRAGSEAMVNIRATFERAAEQQAISQEECALLERIGKSLFYPRRHYAAILERAGEEGMPAARIERLRGWLARGRVDRKREDALELLGVLAAQFAERPAPKRVRYAFSRTEMWDFAMRQESRKPSAIAARGADELLLDEVRLLGLVAYRDRWDGALLRVLAEDEAGRQELGMPPESAHEAVRALERRHGAGWAEPQDLDRDELAEFLAGETRLNLVRKLRRPESMVRLAAELRSRGALDSLGARARSKQKVLSEMGADEPDLASAGIARDELVAWSFNRTGRAAPEDLGDYAGDLDLPGADVLIQLLLREYLFVRNQEGPGH
jgi:hypothetical protein